MAHDEISAYTPDELNMTEAEYIVACAIERYAAQGGEDAEAYALRILVKLRIFINSTGVNQYKEIRYLLEDTEDETSIWHEVTGGPPKFDYGQNVAPVDLGSDMFAEVVASNGDVFRPNIGVVDDTPKFHNGTWTYHVAYPRADNTTQKVDSTEETLQAVPEGKVLEDFNKAIEFPWKEPL